MRYFSLILILTAALGGDAQSRRVAPGASSSSPAAAAPVVEVSVKEMFEEANGYLRVKAAEFDAKKIAFTDQQFRQTKLEQRQLAAKYAATAAARTLARDDLYYLGMLHWIAENLDGTLDALNRFTAGEGVDGARRQTALSVVIVALAKQSKLDEAESRIAEYLKNTPTRLTERSRIGGEMAKAYQVRKDFKRMTPHAEAGYSASKALLGDATSRARGLDEILDAAMLVFEAHRDAGEQKKAEDALEDMRQTAAEIGSPSFYYYAADQKIRYLIETGRKPAAMDYYLGSLINAGKAFSSKTAGTDVISRLKKREKHYKLLGEPAPDLPVAGQWFPGTARPLSAYKGKVVLLDFWATWCMPCFEAFPHLIEWYQDYNREGFEILGITRFYGQVNGAPADEQNETSFLKYFRQRERLPYDIVVMKDQATQNTYGATALPTAVLLDRKGVVRYIETGTSSARLGQMREMLQKLIAEK